MKPVAISFFKICYVYFLKPILFCLDPETVHTKMVSAGEWMGKQKLFKTLFRGLFQVRSESLKTTVTGIVFENPVGLAAGFDYEGRLTGILDPVGFGFQTIGTITNDAYEGNPAPRLGRLPRSRSLLVNKGFKNPGAAAIIRKLSGESFTIPVGVSIGRTNTARFTSVDDAVLDIVNAFYLFELSTMEHTHYELNISCPNLLSTVDFYDPENLDQLLTSIDGLEVTRPVWIKMPIEKDDAAVLEMLDVILKHRVAAVIFGNLQKKRNDPALVPAEVAKCGKGNFSGKPTQKRSDELIALAYHHVNGKIAVIGCGGIFSPEDAYRKIRLGASLVQFITGMVFQGPQTAAELNLGLVTLLKQGGFSSVKDALGAEYRV